jgi:hypothetical protein
MWVADPLALSEEIIGSELNQRTNPQRPRDSASQAVKWRRQRSSPPNFVGILNRAVDHSSIPQASSARNRQEETLLKAAAAEDADGTLGGGQPPLVFIVVDLRWVAPPTPRVSPSVGLGDASEIQVTEEGFVVVKRAAAPCRRSVDGRKRRVPVASLSLQCKRTSL